jgi:hypothetical protein
LSTLSTSSTRVQGEGRDGASRWIARLREQVDRAIARAALNKRGIS